MHSNAAAEFVRNGSWIYTLVMIAMVIIVSLHNLGVISKLVCPIDGADLCLNIRICSCTWHLVM